MKVERNKYPLISGQGKAHHGAILREAAQSVEAGRLVPVVAKNSYSLETIESAFEAVGQRQTDGKVIL